MANPAFTHPQRTALYQAIASIEWAPAQSNPFIGGWQPLAPRKFPPSLLSVDSPGHQQADILVLQAIDHSSYLKAQRWAADKVIVSIDNPPTQDDERTAVMNVLYSIWNAPVSPLPQLQRKIAAVSVTATTSTADWFSQGVGVATFVGQASDVADWNSVAIGTAAFVGSATDAADWTSPGLGTATWVGDFLLNTAPKTAFQQQIIRAWDPPSVLPQRIRFGPPSPAVATSSADWSSTGVGVAMFVGQAADTADWMAAGVSVATFNGQAVDAADWNAIGVSTVAWIGTAAQAGAADWFSVGKSTAQFVSPSSRPSAITRDGWRVQSRLAERRRRKDEDEIMAIAKAVLPFVRCGIKSAARIDL